MYIYVLNKHNKPLMPCNPRKARKLLEEGKATVVTRTPFTIKLKYGSYGYKQKLTLGIDSGYANIGLSVASDKREYFSAKAKTRTDIVDLLSTRRENRRTRRNRLRYRKPRFNNRKASKKEGWLAPSIINKIEEHIVLVNKVNKILPIYNIIVEVASFDIQKIKNPDIEGSQYQEGEQLGFWNVREYVLFRDNHQCQCCKGKSKDKILNVHHIESRKTGGDAPNNLVTLCETCHTKYHQGLINLPKTIRRGAVFKEAAFMGVMRWTFYNKLKELYPNVSLTYGYITKNTRITNNLEKDHHIDARCITNNPCAIPSENIFIIKKIRCHNRQIHKANFLKGGRKKRNQAPYEVFGYHLWNKVLFQNKECFISGRRSSGYFKLVDIDGKTIKDGVKYTKLKPLEHNKSYIIERRSGSSHD